MENQVEMEQLQKQVIKIKPNFLSNLTEISIISGLKGEPGNAGAPGLPGLPGQIGDAGMYTLIFYFYFILYL